MLRIECTSGLKLRINVNGTLSCSRKWALHNNKNKKYCPFSRNSTINFLTLRNSKVKSPRKCYDIIYFTRELLFFEMYDLRLEICNNLENVNKYFYKTILTQFTFTKLKSFKSKIKRLYILICNWSHYHDYSNDKYNTCNIFDHNAL